MAAESIGTLIPTKIPGYADAADIQAALRLYHYGSYTFDINETDKNNLINPSVAYSIQSLADQISAIDGIAPSVLTAKGSLISASSASTPSVLSVGTNGYVLAANSATTTGLQWVNSASTSQTLTNKTMALGSNTISGTIAQFNTALTDGNFSTEDDMLLVLVGGY